MALKEYEEGVYVQTRDTLSGQVLLAQSESQRQLDRLQWAETQFKKGYLSASQVTSERLGQLRAVINLARTKGEQARLQRYTAPVTIRSHEARIESLRSTLAYQELRLKRSTEQLTSFRQQVDRCKIKAPHDGFVIYAQDDDDDERIEPGAQVRYKMDMFYLPDLSDMEVVTELHETIVERVREGMTARVRVEALPDFAIEGHVTSISPLPEVNRGARGVSEIRNFRGTVKLHSVPERLRPGMTAEVEIVTAARPSAVVLPPGAVAYERGQGFCLVARDDTVERRPISLGEGTPDLVEVTKGLVPGEEVLLDPSSVDFSEIVRTSGSVPAAESLVSPAD
jgi:HlyD family secretion protein